MSNGTNNSASKLHTIGTSWARYTMTVPAASSTQIDNDNSNEMQVNFWLHAGSTFTSGTMSASLEPVTNANRAAGIGSIFASTDNEIEITGIQLEVGSQATPFEHRSFGEELTLCQRYFELLNGGIAMGASDSATNTQASVQYKVSKRAGATIAKSGTVYANDGATQGTVSGVANSKDFTSGVLISFTTSSISNNEVIYIYANNEADGITADAEL